MQASRQLEAIYLLPGLDKLSQEKQQQTGLVQSFNQSVVFGLVSRKVPEVIDT
jgi:hypothetical protein